MIIYILLAVAFISLVAYFIVSTVNDRRKKNRYDITCVDSLVEEKKHWPKPKF